MLGNDSASRALGMTLTVPAPGEAVTAFTVRADMVNGHDLCHGGMLFALADSAFAFACNGYNRVAVATGAGIDFVAPARRGDRVEAHARERYRRGRSGVYDVDVRRADGTLLAVFRGRSLSRDETIVSVD
ncbi:MAG: hydroxyphenylacetyl-CoA thioesterase PaaI [Pseudomonadota bacterium]